MYEPKINSEKFILWNKYEEDGRDVSLYNNSRGILNSGGDCKLNSNHWTLGCTVVMGLELGERLLSKQFFFVVEINYFKKCKKKMYEPKINWFTKKNCKNLLGEVNKLSALCSVPIYENRAKKNKTELFRSNFWQKKLSKNRAFEPKKKQSKMDFFTYSFTSATKIPKKIPQTGKASLNRCT